MDVRLLESVQRKWTREAACVGHFNYQERLRTLKLCCIYGRLKKADLIKCWKVFHSEINVGLQDLFTVSVEWRARGHPLKILLSRCDLELRKIFSGLCYSEVELVTCIGWYENFTLWIQETDRVEMGEYLSNVL